MEIEFEATFTNIDKEAYRKKLNSTGALLVKKEFLQKRMAFYLPNLAGEKTTWARVRDEQDKISMSIKRVSGDAIQDQREIMLTVDDFDTATEFLYFLGCKKKAYQETRRELWSFQGADITIDEWPFLEPFTEIEATSESVVQSVAQALGFNYGEANFGSVTQIYARKYGVSPKIINETELLTFDIENPFT